MGVTRTCLSCQEARSILRTSAKSTTTRGGRSMVKKDGRSRPRYEEQEASDPTP